MLKRGQCQAVGYGRATAGAPGVVLSLVGAFSAVGCGNGPNHPFGGAKASTDVSTSGSAHAQATTSSGAVTSNAAGTTRATSSAESQSTAAVGSIAVSGALTALATAIDAADAGAAAGDGSARPAVSGVGSAAGSASAGTGSESDAGATDAPGVSIDEFCSLLQKRARSWLRECRLGFGDSRAWWGTQAIDEFCSSGRAAVAAGRLSYDPLQAEACAAGSVNGCDEIAAFAYLASDAAYASSPCRGVVVGSVSVGGQCHADSTQYASECRDGFCGGSACPGTCNAFVALGQDCDATPQCGPGAYCSANKCRAYVALGADCTSGTCDPMQVCITETLPNPTCVEKRSLGEACQWKSQCSRGDCYQSKCTAEVPLGAPCNNGAYCAPDAQCTNDVCAPLLAVGADCTDGLYVCADGAQCVNGKCPQLSQAGGTCPCVRGLWCDVNNTCQVLRKLGADCSQSNPQNVEIPCEAPLRCRATLLNQGTFTAFVCSNPGNQGEPCQFTSACKSPLFCDPTTSRCQPPAPKDAACNPALALDTCQAGLFCECTAGNCPTELCRGSCVDTAAPGACRVRAANDETCVNNAGCSSGNCVNQKCAPDAQCR
jgi:hypothetical protein